MRGIREKSATTNDDGSIGGEKIKHLKVLECVVQCFAEYFICRSFSLVAEKYEAIVNIVILIP